MALLGTGFFRPVLFGQATHGTVNIFLANQSGLVALTDSRLSSNGSKAGSGQKLFRLDEQTVCAIAGFYRDPGPLFGAAGHIAYNSVPNLIAHYVEKRSSLSDELIDQKLTSLIDIFQFSLEAVTNLEVAAGNVSLKPSNSAITVAGFERGKLVVAHAELEPTLVGKKYNYELKDHSVATVGNSIFNLVAGLREVAARILENPDLYAADDPIVQRYRSSLKSDHGASLKLEDLKKLAEYLEFRTALNYPTEVGGDSQTAILQEGKISQFDQPVSKMANEPQRLYFDQPDDITVINPPSMRSAIAINNRVPGLVIFVTRGHFEYVTQRLDEMVFLESKFEHCTLEYDGSQIALIDQSSNVVDCSLVLGPAVDSDDPFVSSLRTRYPSLTIVSHARYPGNKK